MSEPSLLSRQFNGKAAVLLQWMGDPLITDLLINGIHSLYVEREGKLLIQPSPFPDLPSLMDFIERLLIPIGRRMDATHPYIDGRCVDGTRFHIILPPVAVNGPHISLRKFSDSADACPLESFGPASVTEWLSSQVIARKNILIAGGTGAGKTTLLSRLLERVSPDERIAVIEETMEIQARHPHLLRLEAREPSPEGKGEVTLRCLLRQTLRMRPDRIVLGECRGAEALDLLQVMNTGHPGSLGTIHANGCLDALRRLEGLALFSGFPLSVKTLREWIGAAISVVVYLERSTSGRSIREILLLHGLEGEVYRMTPWFRAERN